MPDTVQPQALQDDLSASSHYVSFVLRCWTGGSGQVHARLFVVHSGASHLVANLDSLPALVRQLVTRSLPPAPHQDTEKPRR